MYTKMNNQNPIERLEGLIPKLEKGGVYHMNVEMIRHFLEENAILKYGKNGLMYIIKDLKHKAYYHTYYEENPEAKALIMKAIDIIEDIIS